LAINRNDDVTSHQPAMPSTDQGLGAGSQVCSVRWSMSFYLFDQDAALIGREVHRQRYF
jgi:hypothetical protein